MRKSDRDMYKEMYLHKEPIWIYAKMKSIHLMRKIMEYYGTRQRYLRTVFIELEKAYDKVPREVLLVGDDKEGHSQEIHQYSARYVSKSKHMLEHVEGQRRIFQSQLAFIKAQS